MVAISTVTISELLGAYLTSSESRRANRLNFVQEIVGATTVLNFDADAAHVHARIWAELRRFGTMIGAHDLIIAATPLANGYSVLTNNIREFRRVPGLIVTEARF